MEFDTVQIVEFRHEDAEKISKIITRNLLEVNIRDYPEEEVMRLVSEHTSEKIINRYGCHRKLFVALVSDEPVGTLGVDGPSNEEEVEYHFMTIFVHPDYHHRGIGRVLMEQGERYVRKMNGQIVMLSSSITAHKFYNKLGYEYKGGIHEPDANGLLSMIKYLL